MQGLSSCSLSRLAGIEAPAGQQGVPLWIALELYAGNWVSAVHLAEPPLNFHLLAHTCFPSAGHAYYFLEDVYPRMTGRRPLKTPGFVRAMFPGDAGLMPEPLAAAAPPARRPPQHLPRGALQD